MSGGRQSAFSPRARRAILYFVLLDLFVIAAILLRSPFALLQAPAGLDTWPIPAPLQEAASPTSVPAAPTATRPAPAARPLPTTTPGPIPQPPTDRDAALQARIEIVWPHGGAPLADADLANVTVYLLGKNGAASVPCDADPVVRLWRAEDTRPARPVAVGQKRMFTGGGRTFPVWDFNDVDVSHARDPGATLKFFATVDGVPTLHNVWVHGADSRTVFPRADVPTRVTDQRPAAVEVRIQILWPHDNAPADRAWLANLTVYLLDASTGYALAPDIAWQPQVRLHWALNNEPDQGPASSAVGTPRRVTTSNGLSFLAWDFNDVDVSPGRDSLNRMHFWATVDDTPTLSNIWTHGAVAATIFPQVDVPTSCE